MITQAIEQSALDQIFFDARTHRHWQDRSVSKHTLDALYALMRLGPTSGNCSPGRFVFLTTKKAHERLKDCLAGGNVRQTMSAPVTVIVAYDTEFYEQLPYLSPHNNSRAWFVGKPVAIESTGFRNSSLQAAYLIIAARSLGLDCGPMSGFSPKEVNEEFFLDTTWKVNMLINLGYGINEKLHDRQPRLDFATACEVL
jgi:3-hydroxypropanoate dehydrogenase